MTVVKKNPFLFPFRDSQYARIELSCQLGIYHKLVDNGRVHAGVRRAGIQLVVATRRVFYQSTRAVASRRVPDFQSHVYTRQCTARQRSRCRSLADPRSTGPSLKRFRG